MTDRAVILSVVGVYMVACIAIGVWASRRTKSAADFFVAGKGIGIWIFGIANFSTLMSGFGFIGGPGLVYSLGASSFWICVPATFAFVFSWILVSKRLRIFSQLFDVLTLPDAIAARYESRTCRFLGALVVLLGVAGYLGVQILAFGMIAQSFFAIDHVTAILAGTGVVLVYSVAGGIIAGLYTDLFQGALMVFASLAIFYLALDVAGDGSVFEAPRRITDAFLASDTPEAVGPWGMAGPMLCLSWLFVFAVGGSGQPHVITKSIMLRRVGDLRGGLIVTALAYSICMLLWISVGFTMKYLVLTDARPALADPDHAAPMFLLEYTPAWLAGIVFAGLFAAIMSTADAFLNLGAAVFVRDIPQALIGRPMRNELAAARVATAVVAIAAAGVALWAEDLVAILGIFSWGMFAAALVPTVAIGFNWQRATWQGASAAMACGVAVHLSLELLRRYPQDDPLYTLPRGVSAGAVSLMVSILVFIVVSLATPPQRLSERVERAMKI